MAPDLVHVGEPGRSESGLVELERAARHRRAAGEAPVALLEEVGEDRLRAGVRPEVGPVLTAAAATTEGREARDVSCIGASRGDEIARTERAGERGDVAVDPCDLVARKQ